MGRYLSFASLILLLIVSCQKEKSFELGNPSKGSLQDSLGDCLSKAVAGNYIAAKPLIDSNYIDVTVNVTQPGRYTVYTDTVNGYYFRATGNFASAGPATVRMQGIGTPSVVGSDDFIIFYDSTYCTVTVTVLPAGSSGGTISKNYFPLTDSSYWTYDDEPNADTLKTSVGTVVVKNNRSYKQFISVYGSGPPNDTSFYRKDNSTGAYYTYIDTAWLSGNGLSFSQPGLDVLFLKDSLNTNDSLKSDFNVTFSGIPAIVRFKYTCTNANASVTTVSGKNFTNLYELSFVIQLGSGGVFTDATQPTKFYYANGIGLIKVSDPTYGDQTIRYWKVL